MTENHALQKAYAYLPESEHIIYVGFPWSNFFNAIAAQSSELTYWLERLDATIAEIVPASRTVTVCEHEDLLMHIPLLKTAGITDVFWSYATAVDCATPNCEIWIHPFPIYPADSELVVIENNFGLCATHEKFDAALLWKCLHKDLIPVMPENSYALPGNKDLWNTATILYRDDEPALLPEKIQEATQNMNVILDKKLALNQLIKCYGAEFFITDIVEFFFNQDSKASNSEEAKKRYFYSDGNIIVHSFVSNLIINSTKTKSHFLKNYFFQKKVYYLVNDMEDKKRLFYKKIMRHYGINIG